MSGLCVVISDARWSDASLLLRRTADALTGPNPVVSEYVRDGLAMVVASRFAVGGLCQSFGQITEDERYVLCLEGYLSDLDRHAAPGDSDRGRLLLQLYHRHGPSLFRRSKGSFQFALIDKRLKSCTVGVSRFAERTLYRAKLTGGWVFASEVKVMPLWLEEPLTLSLPHVSLAFVRGDTLGRRTLFREATRFMPGEVQVLRPEKRAPVSLLPARPSQTAKALPFTDSVERTDELLSLSIRRLMNCNDQAKAVLMGSGIDSAVIAGLVKRITGAVRIVTQAMPGEMNEAPGATRTARGVGAEHHVVPYRAADVDLLSALREFVHAVEAPAFWAQLAAPMVTLSSEVKDRASTFLLGIMSDSLMEFAGDAAGLRQRLSRWKGFARAGLFLPGAHVERSYFRRRAGIIRSHSMQRRLTYLRMNRLAARAPRDLESLYDVQWLNVRTTSRLIQKHGGEALLPYLDEDVMQHFMSMPTAYRFDKRILLAVLHRLMPLESAPKHKTGFGAKVLQWHHEANNLDRALDLLSDRRTRWRGLYDDVAVTRLIDSFRKRTVNEPAWFEVLYQFLLFELFCRQFLDTASPEALITA